MVRDGVSTSLSDQVAALRAGATSSAELVESALSNIESTQGTLNAFRIVCRESAPAEAARADERLADGERLPLLGVPVAIKDDVDLAGHPTSFGCAGAFPAEREDCEMVRRLRAAGAVIVGKTNSPEVGLYPFTEGRAFGITRNPWSLDHTPGGSSGGSAAAVAAGIVAVAVGSDGAGSVRIPASWCNLVGVKPQRGRISTWPEPESFNGLTCLVSCLFNSFTVRVGGGHAYSFCCFNRVDRRRAVGAGELDAASQERSGVGVAGTDRADGRRRVVVQRGDRRSA